MCNKCVAINNEVSSLRLYEYTRYYYICTTILYNKRSMLRLVVFLVLVRVVLRITKQEQVYSI